MTKHRTQVLLEETQYAWLARKADREGVSVSEWLRRLVDRELDGMDAAPDLSPICGIASGPSMTNKEIDDFLYGADSTER